MFALSRIPILAVGSQEAFDRWDLNATCPSTYVLAPDMTLRVADGVGLDLDLVESWL